MAWPLDGLGRGKVALEAPARRKKRAGFSHAGPLRAAGRGSYGAMISLHCLPAAERVFGSSRVPPPGTNPVPTMGGRPLGRREWKNEGREGVSG